MLKKMKLGPKLMGAFLTVGLIPFAALAMVSLTSSSSALSRQAFSQLESMCEVKQSQIMDLFAGIRGDMDVLLETVKVLRREAFEKLLIITDFGEADLNRAQYVEAESMASPTY